MRFSQVLAAISVHLHVTLSAQSQTRLRQQLHVHHAALATFFPVWHVSCRDGYQRSYRQPQELCTTAPVTQ